MFEPVLIVLLCILCLKLLNSCIVHIISCIFISDAHAKHEAAVFAQPFCLVHVILVRLEASEGLSWELHLFNGAVFLDVWVATT